MNWYGGAQCSWRELRRIYNVVIAIADDRGETERRNKTVSAIRIYTSAYIIMLFCCDCDTNDIAYILYRYFSSAQHPLVLYNIIRVRLHNNIISYGIGRYLVVKITFIAGDKIRRKKRFLQGVQKPPRILIGLCVQFDFRQVWY